MLGGPHVALGQDVAQACTMQLPSLIVKTERFKYTCKNKFGRIGYWVSFKCSLDNLDKLELFRYPSHVTICIEKYL